MEREILAFAEAVSKNNPLLAYIFFFLNAVLQVVFPPYPGDSVIVFQGYLTSIGILKPSLLFLSTLAGTFLSSIFLYAVSYKYGEKITKISFVKRYFNVEKIYKLKKWFSKYGALAIIINKFIPGIGSLTLIGAGLFKLKTLPAVISIAAASYLRILALFIAGRFTGDNLELLLGFINQYNRLIVSVILAALAVYIYIKYIGGKRKQG